MFVKKNATVTVKKPEDTKFVFASSDIRYREKPADVKSEESGEESPKKKSSTGIASTSSLGGNETELSLKIPGVVSSNKLPKTSNGLTDQIVKRARDGLWSSPDTPPAIVTPSVLHFVTKEGNLFESAVESLINAKEIGLSVQFEAELLPRDGSLSLLCVSTSSDVYIFDVLEIGQEVFKWGLRQILMNPDCVKVVHDGRLLSDLLLRQYDLNLINVFDTLAAHVVFASGLTRKEINRRKPLYSAVRDYLGVRGEDLLGQSSTGGEMWLRRPLERQEELLMAAARETMYLLELCHILQLGLELTVKRATEIIMQTALEEVEPQAFSYHIVPSAMNSQ